MKSLLLCLLLWQAAELSPAVVAEPRYLRYERVVTLPAEAEGQACATLDASVYAHGEPSLKDVRLYDGTREVPYAVTLSESVDAESEPARVLNLGMRGTKIVFDLAMPTRSYTDVVLDLAGRDFVGAAEVWGSNATEVPVRLGTFTVFDLSGQRLSRSTALHLEESSFRTLHVELSVAGARGGAVWVPVPGMVLGATVPPDREAQTVYTTVAQTAELVREGRLTVAKLRLPAHVPVERVAVVPGAGYVGNFSRDVVVTARTAGHPDNAVERVAGTIVRVRMEQSGRALRQEQLSVPATLGANLQTDAEVQVSIDNGNDAPLPVAAVQLEMRERRLCFPAQRGMRPKLLYGDAMLEAPVYDFARVFVPGGKTAAARLGPEERNPAFVERPETARSLTERHPELLWVALLAVVCVLAVVAIHSARRMPR